MRDAENDWKVNAMNKKVKPGMYARIILMLAACVMLFVQGCGKEQILPSPSPSPTVAPTVSPSPSAEPTAPVVEPSPEETPDVSPTPEAVNQQPIGRTDYENYGPDESGEIPIMMFHNFVPAFEPGMDKEFTTTFEAFERLLSELYDRGFRLISMRDFIDCNIDIPAGTMPMVFTFDDGTPGQFNMIDDGGVLRVNPQSAVGIMMRFSEQHPDFGLRGIFYVNMDIGGNTFKGAGSLKDRFQFLIDNGFELGSHTWGHVKFKEVSKPDTIQECLGRNQEAILSIMPGVQFYSMALPYGSLPGTDELKALLTEGEYKGIRYSHQNIMAVGANPSQPAISRKYNPNYVPRIRMEGQAPVNQDITWWLPKMTTSRMYVSDGDPNTIVVPAGHEDRIDPEKLHGKELITY
jgi:hypothetical protein